MLKTQMLKFRLILFRQNKMELIFLQRTKESKVLRLILKVFLENCNNAKMILLTTGSFHATI